MEVIQLASKALDILLGEDKIEKRQEKQVKVKRLGVVFTLQSLGYNRVAEIRKLGDERIPLHILLAGVVDPDFKNAALQEKYGAVTPAELIEKILLPGEIEDLSRMVEKLSGYRSVTIEEIKKK
jgi:hypothetical protein